MGNRLPLKFLQGLAILGALASVHCGTTPVRYREKSDVTTEIDRQQKLGERDPSSLVPAQPKLLKLMWPLAIHRVTQNFHQNQKHRRDHDGIDIGAPQGTRIYAPAAGTVIYAGHKFRGYGKMIMIEHTPRLTTLFGHCQKILVKSGEAVKKGSLIGLVGRTGRATAPHLHFEVRINRDPVDPIAYLPQGD